MKRVSALCEEENVQNVLAVPGLEDFQGVDIDLNAACLGFLFGQEM